MEQILGIKYGNATGRRYVQVDLDVHGENELLQDFLDGLEVEATKGKSGEYVSLEELNSYVDERLKKNV